MPWDLGPRDEKEAWSQNGPLWQEQFLWETGTNGRGLAGVR
jgi:hypothetical protein